MKFKIKKRFIIIPAAAIIVAVCWLVYVNGSTQDYFYEDTRTKDAEHLSPNVIDNKNVICKNYGLFEKFDSDYDYYCLMANGNTIYLAPKEASDKIENWPYATINSNDSNYSLSHFTANCYNSIKSDENHGITYLDEVDNIDGNPMLIKKTDWNIDKFGLDTLSTNNFYACFADKVSTEVSGNKPNLGSISPESSYFYMYSPAYEANSCQYKGLYERWALSPRDLVSKYNITASEIDESNGSCTLTLINPSYYSQNAKDAQVSFIATPSHGATFLRWEYYPTINHNNDSPVQLYPGNSVKLTQEQLLTARAVFSDE